MRSRANGLVNSMKSFQVKTTKELLEQIQSRGSSRPSRPASPRSPHSPASPASPDVMLIEPDGLCHSCINNIYIYIVALPNSC